MNATQRQSEIADHAMRLFATRGYEATSMRDLAEAVGVRAASLYNHFSSKHEIIFFIAMRSMRELTRLQQDTLAGESNPARQLELAMAAHIHFHATHKEDIQVTLQALKALQQDARSELLAFRRSYVYTWTEILKAGVRNGQFDCPNPKLSAYALIDMGIGVSTWYNPEGPQTLEQIKQYYSQLALRTVSNPLGSG
ncbi:TetR/AcrR family transcriptional regulator [Corynebacterium gerontici]|uniref:HTH-type transcriptional repressor KstR2 n=1 Tax=Corynebacterium gerontici TaxID=2079234 RepID=A0A3G6J0M0_9CORY|nr:TetR/AcrR family transcriptional regulator [Corynebacterium gerontici]AZA11466.1 HTH-type transcriptional repressor KstR2 [Corynebacterium gerontici]